jgi:hypothetical protein
MDTLSKAKNTLITKYIQCIYYVTEFSINKLKENNQPIHGQKKIVMRPQLIAILDNGNETNKGI